ncbi:MFS transporter [Paraburkholderia sp. RL18-103-BIB-C]|uniref:MFS transporter n=1 Tax=Paraburkholderia sp. RL18-103-BIB-C TaxID=3031637 RepID=UPI0038B85A03
MNTSSPRPHLSATGLAVLLTGQLLPIIDFSIVNVALASISQTLKVTQTWLGMVVAVYGVAFAVCLAMAGRLGDNFGRRRLFGIGVAVFAVASLLCGLATSIWVLLAARALQGAGAALVVPQTLATIHVCLHGREHSRALGIYGSISGISFVVGQVLGGLLVTANWGGAGWRAVFLINLPICAGVLLLMWRTIPETRVEKAISVDVSGTVILALLTLCLLIPLALGPTMHWPIQLDMLLACVVPLMWLLRRVEINQERRGVSPLLPPALARLPSTRFGALIAAIMFSSWSGFMFASALTLQTGAGLSPAKAGNSYVSLGIAFFAGSLLTPRLVARLGNVPTLLSGCAVQMLGLVTLMATLDYVWPHPGLVNLIPATALIGFGQALIVSCFYRIGLSDVPASQAGAGSAMLATVQQVSFGLGPAVFGGIFSYILRETSGSYLHAMHAALLTELALMSLLCVRGILYHRWQQTLKCAPYNAAQQ